MLQPVATPKLAESVEAHVGNQSLTLTLLPDSEPRWRQFATSLLAHAALLAAAIAIPVAATQPQLVRRTSTYLVMPLASTYKAPQQVAAAPRVKLPPRRMEPVPVPVVKLETPRELVRREPEPVAPKLQPAKFDPVITATPRIPKPPRVVKTGVMDGPSSGSSAAATLKTAAHKVQTGGFGEVSGINGEGRKDAKLTLAHMGSPDLPNFGGGFGNGSGGARGARGTVSSAGFGGGVATDSPARSGGNGVVRPGGFGDATATAASVARPRSTDDVPAFLPVEILFKPDPVYTEEARRKKLEGEVLLEVMFGANGDLRILRVARGLGLGLDESAVRAAQQIRFKPARRNGQPADTAALLHINFQLAY